MKRRIQKFMRNPGLKLISVLIACLIWLMVSNINDPEITKAIKNIPITFKNQDTISNLDKTFTIQDGIDRVNVYVTGRKSVVANLTNLSFVVKADMLNYNETLGTVPLEITCSNTMVRQENMRILPSAIQISMEDKVEESFGIAVSVVGKTEKGYEIGSTSIVTGDTIRIAGPDSLVRIIGKVTVSVDISDMNSDSVERYPIRIEDKNGAFLTDSQMKKLEIKDTEGVVLADNMATVQVSIWKIYPGIPVELSVCGTPADNYQISEVTLAPKTVNLVGEEKAIEELGGRLVLQDYISVEGMKESQEYVLDLNETLAKYSNIRLEADTASTIVAYIEISEHGSTGIQVPISQLEMKNIPKEKKLIFSPADYVMVNIKTEEEDLNNLSADMITGSIDLKNCNQNGNYTIPVVLDLPEGYTLVSEVSIVVNIEDADQEAEVEAALEG